MDKMERKQQLLQRSFFKFGWACGTASVRRIEHLLASVTVVRSSGAKYLGLITNFGK
jgi:hypothetical protein